LLQVEAGIEAAALQSRDLAKLAVRMQLSDDYAHRGLVEWKRAWREFLRLGNLLQFVDRFDFVTSLGLADEMYSPLIEPAPEPQREALTDRLTALQEIVTPELCDLCRRIVEQGKVLPEAGFELTDASGEIVATAELAWPDQMIAIVLERDADGVHRFEAAGWRVFNAASAVGAPDMILDLLPVAGAE
jgi:DEAD/DEAH box helicase domain-containing protein